MEDKMGLSQTNPSSSQEGSDPQAMLGEDAPDNLLDLGPLSDTPISPAVAVASVALNMALKYADITTVQDGALYQQYKLEGKNLQGLHLDYVFDIATRIERHLMTSANRLSEVVYGTLLDAISDEPDEDPAAGGNATKTGADDASGIAP